MTADARLLSKIEPLIRKLELPDGALLEALARAGLNSKTLLERLAHLTDTFGLDSLEQVLIVALLVDELTAGGLNLESASLERNSLALSELFGFYPNRILRGGSPLFDRALVTRTPAARLHPEISGFLLGETTLPEGIRRYLRESEAIKSYSIWIEGQAQALENALRMPTSLSLIYTSDPAQDLLELRRIAKMAGRRLFQINLEQAMEEAGHLGIGDLFKRIGNSVLLSGGCAVLVACQNLTASQQTSLLSELSGSPTLLLLTDGDAALKNAIHRSYFEFTSDSKTSVHGRLWHLEAAERKLQIPEETLKNLESVFPFSLPKVERVLAQLALEPKGVGFLKIAALCRRQSSRVLEQLARRIEPKYNWENLRLPPASKLRLSEIYHFIAGRSRTDHDWKLRQKHNRGHGVTLVLKGASGTGKTMAAEVLARELGLDLYQVDLASLTSKYVGETEKNLSRIFQAARESSGILLFDEGEVLFSQRTEVSTSQDKYANLEVNYLLQELEAFDGIVIISTNQARTIDTAFLRRVTFDLEIPRPDEATRKEIWISHLAGGLPLATDMDFEFLAKLLIPGGLIRNIVKQASSIASQHGDEIRMADVLHAVKREFTKTGEPLEREFFGETYWPIVSAEWEAVYAHKKRKTLLAKP